MRQRPPIPPGLLEAFRARRAAVFLGAGASIGAGMPSWAQLVADLAGELGIDVDRRRDREGDLSPRLLGGVPEYYESRYGRRQLTERLRQLIPSRSLRPSPIHSLVASLPCDLYYTTNFDKLLENALREQHRDFQRVATEDDARDYAERNVCQVRKIHGTLATWNSLVLTRSDFAQFVWRHPFMTEQLRVDLTSNTFLFLGYSLGDPDFNSIYDNVFFGLTPMHRRHYVSVLDVEDYEKVNLDNRGFEPIDLGLWEGETPTEMLHNFLSDLCEATSDALHIGRFFKALDRDEEVPVVIPSRPHERERYLFYPQMDIHAAESIKKALATIGVTAKVDADRMLLENAEEVLARDIILIGSPRGNALTRYVFEQAERTSDPDYPITTRFVNHGDTRALEDPSRGISFRVPDPAVSPSRGTEYALIARYRNPWAPGKYLYVLAGLWAMGTYAIGDFLDDTRNYRLLPWEDDDAVVVLEAEYESHDAYNYKYDLRLLSKS